MNGVITAHLHCFLLSSFFKCECISNGGKNQTMCLRFYSKCDFLKSQSRLGKDSWYMLNEKLVDHADSIDSTLPNVHWIPILSLSFISTNPQFQFLLLFPHLTFSTPIILCPWLLWCLHASDILYCYIIRLFMFFLS